MLRPVAIRSNLAAIKAGMMPSNAVGTRSTSTPMSFAICFETSTSNPMSSPVLSRIAHGTKVESPTRRRPRLTIDWIVLSAAAGALWALAVEVTPLAASDIGIPVSSILRGVMAFPLDFCDGNLIRPIHQPRPAYRGFDPFTITSSSGSEQSGHAQGAGAHHLMALHATSLCSPRLTDLPDIPITVPML